MTVFPDYVLCLPSKADPTSLESCDLWEMAVGLRMSWWGVRLRSGLAGRECFFPTTAAGMPGGIEEDTEAVGWWDALRAEILEEGRISSGYNSTHTLPLFLLLCLGWKKPLSTRGPSQQPVKIGESLQLHCGAIPTAMMSCTERCLGPGGASLGLQAESGLARTSRNPLCKNSELPF